MKIPLYQNFVLVFATIQIILIEVSNGQLNYNLMNCMDFARHISGTVPSRFGLFGQRSVRSAPKNLNPKFRTSKISRQLVNGADVGAEAAAAAGGMDITGMFRNLLFQVLNVGDENTLSCQGMDRFASCASIDDYLEQQFPSWFFEWRVTDNFNHVLGQLTSSPYHSLFEAGIKAYRCFCQC